MAQKDRLGRSGEDLAEAWAREQGWQVLARNWRGSQGELDLVARDAGCLVVIEVKTRRSTAFGVPIEAVTAEKLRRLRRLTAEWLLAHRPAGISDVRIDVLGILWPAGAEPQLQHLAGVA